MPLKNTRILPKNWSAHHMRAAEGFFTGKATINEPGTVGEWPDYEVILGKVLYSGFASAQELENGKDADVVDAVENIRTYRISIPLTQAPEIPLGAEAPTVTFTECPDDPDLIGRPMGIVDVQHGTTNWTRDLVCVEMSRRRDG